jgi:hypothetical protein
MDIDLTIPFQRFHQNKEVVGIRDVFDFAQSAQNMLNVNSGREGLGAELSLAPLDDETSVNDIGLVPSPIERLQVVRILLLVYPT